MTKSLMIDAGHGGTDSGATGFGELEKDWNLKMSLYQLKRLRSLGADVDITRTTDKTLDSVPRTNKIKDKYTYCMSNHFNAYNGSARGVETIHSIYANNVIPKAIAQTIAETSDLPLRRVFDKENDNNKDWYFMHRLTGSTETTIVEYGFMDNKEDHNYYKNKDNFYKVAEAVVKTWCDILDIKYKAPSEKKKTSDRLYKVQVGAFSERDNATQQLKKAQKYFPDAFIVKE